MRWHQNRLIFFVVAQDPHIPYALWCPCVYQYHFLLHVQHWNRFRTVYKTKLSPFQDIWYFIIYTPWIAELHTVLLLLWRSWFWTLRHLFCNALISFTVPILPGNNRKLGLNEKLKYLQYVSIIKSSISAKGLLVRLYLFGKLYFFLQLRCRLGVRDMEQKFWKSLHFWKFRYRIYISYMPFWKYWVRISKKSGVSARF